MKNLHATDLDIQKFTFDRIDCEPHLILHINACNECNEKVEAYLSLSNSIKDQPSPSLDYNLSNIILNQLPVNQELETSNGYLISFVLFSIVGLVIWSIYLCRDTFFYLLDNTLTQQSYLLVSIVIFITLFLVYDQLRSFKKKVKILNS